jgi:HPt (histidine-containing phosphotransfer) domain-containing protein
MSDKLHLDQEALAELQDVMEGEFDVLVQTYINDSLERIGGLKAALDAGDAEELAKVAHSLKGSCINIGAPRLGDLCQRAEVAGKSQNLGQVPVLLKAIDAEFQIVSGQFRALLQD